MAKLVRLHPYNPHEGHLLQRYGHRGYRFFEDRGWYKVPDALAAELSEVRQPRAPGSRSRAATPLAFEVADTKAKAKAIEHAATPKPEKASADDPHEVEGGNDLTTGDLATGTAEEASPSEEAPPPARASSRGRSKRRSSGSR